MKTHFRIASLSTVLLAIGTVSIASAQSWVADPVNNELEAGPAASVEVGIGTTSPVGKLHVSSSGSASNPQLVLTQTGSSEWSRIKFDAAGNEFILSVGGPTSATPNTFNVYNSGAPNAGNILSVVNSGNVGINNSSPVSKLQVTDGSVLFNGTAGTTPISGAGTRMMYVPAKGGAFRVGAVTGSNWDDASIGNISFAQGWETIASGYTSVALNSNTTASGDRSFATGYLSVASGVRAAAIGEASVAQAYVSTVVGSCNIISGTTNSWVPTDPIFVVGNGTGAAARSNAVTVLKNGNVGIGTTTPGSDRLYIAGNGHVTGTWTTGSDARFKTNITTLTDALDKVLSLHGVSYDFKTDDFPEMNFPKRKQIGFIAQELEKIIPEVVNTGENGYKAVAYQNLTALLAEAIKDQQEIINQIRTENMELKARLQAVESHLGTTSSEGASFKPGNLK